jgi:mono/diheme cytochrome c family protein
MKTLSFAAAMAVALSVFAYACQENAAHTPENTAAGAAAAELSLEERVERGRYIVSTVGCHDCHSPKVMTPEGPRPDPERLLSGYPSDEKFPTFDLELVTEQKAMVFSPHLTAAAGPWGTVTFAANLTPDDTGTGLWTEAQFVKALREGKSKGMDGTRQLLPPMPWDVYGQMSDEDLKAIYAYLRTVKPVKNVVPAPRPL